MTSAFELLPAIDLRGGRVVRLEQGDFARETSFSDDPVGQALAWASAGARWLHVVDLDGARTGSPGHVSIIESIVAAVAGATRVEVAGGLRSAAAVATVLEAGAARAVIGTLAVEDPPLADEILNAAGPGRIAVAVDVRDGLAVGRGWQPGAPGVPAIEVVERLRGSGVETFEVTAVARDGLMGGPDTDLLSTLVAVPGARVIASGGIRDAADIRAVRGLGCAGAIVGRALYDGSLNLEAALEAAGGDQ